jgi:hypothetical protein
MVLLVDNSDHQSYKVNKKKKQAEKKTKKVPRGTFSHF